jgi:hypothetical protein
MGTHGLHLIRICLLAAAFTLAGCGGGDSNGSPPPVDGTWTAASQVVGSSLTLKLTTQSVAVSGTGTYAIEAGRSGTLTVDGKYQPPQVTLSFVYDYGDSASYTATFSDGNRMSGKLTYQNGTSLDTTFVRQ